MEEKPQGYLHHKLDVKVLILFITARIGMPLTDQELYELAYQDESLNYFTFAESLPELVDSGHLEKDGEGRYLITEKGREQGAAVEDSLAVPVIHKVSAAVERKLSQLRQASHFTTEVAQNAEGYWVVTLRYQDDGRPMMTLSLMAPDRTLGQAMAKNLLRQADKLYKHNLDAAIDSGRGSK